MDKNSFKILKILIKNKNNISKKDDERIYNLYFKNKYSYDIYQDAIFNLHCKKLLIGYKADCMLNGIEINDIKLDEFFIERRKYYWEKVITPILSGLLMPILVSIATTLITTYLVIKK
ncbi:hypothetical protein [Clostridium sp. VAP52]|uniref:hypothetical protein n=1 Tax=Clostridium sp. VAP52 TaxID=2949977 RepID=UPI00207A2ABB|nr:hypothetical protein [Clostridium sp. VAP52]